MNRAARRAAKARTRGRRMNYWDRILAARTSGAMPRANVHICNIEHVRTCGIFHGAACNCVPEISVSGPNGIVVIDEHGNGRKMTRQ